MASDRRNNLAHKKRKRNVQKDGPSYAVELGWGISLKVSIRVHLPYLISDTSHI